ncbi:MAG: FdtA/QdtA family cupin domain-containing protein [Bacteroidales bacterium]|nr:FdtA/QdtA family cupin domain-containing protein [Bacteroidales bacterium]
MSIQKRCKHFQLPLHKDSRGELVVMEENVLGYEWKRVFWIHNVPKGEERGNHAHRTCEELIFVLSGSFEIELFDGLETMHLMLDKPHEGVFIPRMVWCRLYNFSPNAVILCFATQEYLPEGYIHDYQQFIEEFHLQNC